MKKSPKTIEQVDGMFAGNKTASSRRPAEATRVDCKKETGLVHGHGQGKAGPMPDLG